MEVEIDMKILVSFQWIFAILKPKPASIIRLDK